MNESLRETLNLIITSTELSKITQRWLDGGTPVRDIYEAIASVFTSKELNRLLQFTSLSSTSALLHAALHHQTHKE